MSTCVSGHGEYSSHTHGELTSDQRTYYTCAYCGAFDEDAVFEKLAELQAEVKRLEKLTAEAQENDLIAGYDQCLQNMRDVVGETMEATRSNGPAIGLGYLLQELWKNEVDTDPSADMPYDWLSRWKVELA